MRTLNNQSNIFLTISPQSRSKLPINWHITFSCNYRCVFCFQKRAFSKNEICRNLLLSRKIIKRFVDGGVGKVNFAGGEPFLCENLGEIIRITHNHKIAVSIITNGFFLSTMYGKAFLIKYGKFIDWIGFSLDSGKEETEKRIGRGFGDHVKRVRKAVSQVRKYSPNIRIKINTVIGKFNFKEDMHEIIEELSPDRWKVFQLKIIDGVNNVSKSMGVTEKEFHYFIKRHSDLRPVVEDNTLMTNSYIIIDPYGNLIDEDEETKRYRIVGSLFDEPLKNLLERSNFSIEKLRKRGGIYEWREVLH